MLEGSKITFALIIMIIIVLFAYGSKKILFGLEKFTIEETKHVTSSVDNTRYRVHDKHDNPKKAADTLALINQKIIDIMRYMRKKYKHLPSSERKAAVAAILSRYNTDNLAENSPNDPSGDTSYSIDKGAIIAICIRDKVDPLTIHDIQTLVFVSLHELAHIAIDDLDHPPRFWSAFKFILEEAIESGFFVCPDYKNNPVSYCGLNVDYSPIHDKTLPSLPGF